MPFDRPLVLFLRPLTPSLRELVLTDLRTPPNLRTSDLHHRRKGNDTSRRRQLHQHGSALQAGREVGRHPAEGEQRQWQWQWQRTMSTTACLPASTHPSRGINTGVKPATHTYCPRPGDGGASLDMSLSSQHELLPKHLNIPIHLAYRLQCTYAGVYNIRKPRHSDSERFRRY